jgi:hypothetical protein
VGHEAKCRGEVSSKCALDYCMDYSARIPHSTAAQVGRGTGTRSRYVNLSTDTRTAPSPAPPSWYAPHCDSVADAHAISGE